MNISLIEQEIKNIQTELEVISQILQTKKERPLDAIEIRGAALSLGALYNGMEKILIHILTDRGEKIKESRAWHVTLLQKSQSHEILSEITLKNLKGFLSFRHFIRHTYSFEINPKTIEAILVTTPDLVRQFIKEVRSQTER